MIEQSPYRSKLNLMKEQESQRNIKALLCQVSPFYKDKIKTIQRIRISLQMYSPKNELDLLIFPEMSFVGYNFENFEDALPHAVKQNEGIDFDFAKELAVKIKAYVAFGYIEKVVTENETLLYNSAAVIDRSGNMISNYRKWHLYYNDKLWAKEGDSFTFFELINLNNRSIRCGLGICADINQKDFTSGEWELADYLVKTGCDALVFLTNWVDSENDNVTNTNVAATYNYWIHRLNPVVLSKKTFLFLAADRVGNEYDYFAKKNTMFYGSSVAVMFNPSKVLKNLDIKNEGYLLIDTFLP